MQESNPFIFNYLKKKLFSINFYHVNTEWSNHMIHIFCVYAMLKNNSVISRTSILLVDKTAEPGKHNRPSVSH